MPYQVDGAAPYFKNLIQKFVPKSTPLPGLLQLGTYPHVASLHDIITVSMTRAKSCPCL